MRSYRPILLITLCLFLLGTASCSNGNDSSETKTTSSGIDGTIKFQVTAKSTTTDGKTEQVLNNQIEKNLTKTLTQVLINGQNKTDLFVGTAAQAISTTFPNYSKAKNNQASVAYSYMDSQDPNNQLAVADITQSIKTKDGKNISRSGKIYLDSTGKILGYDYADQTTSGQDKQ